MLRESGMGVAVAAGRPKPADSQEYRVADLIALFDELFAQTYRTRLVFGGDEPWYLPADDDNPYHRVVFAHGYFSSALHEVAHWCVAGSQRRLQVDYGYWYIPDGRNTEQQAAFERVETRPQAIEWLFNLACGRGFRPSCDNLAMPEADDARFRRALAEQVRRYHLDGLPPRADLFRQALCRFYRQPTVLELPAFSDAVTQVEPSYSSGGEAGLQRVAPL